MSFLTSSLIAATTTVFIGSTSSPLSKNVIDYIDQNPDLKKNLSIVDIEQEPKQERWKNLESLLARCGISSTRAGIPAIVSEDEGRIECKTSDLPVLSKLRELNGCTALSECVATAKTYKDSVWKIDWTESLIFKEVCVGTDNREATKILHSTSIGNKAEKIGLFFSARKDGRAVLDIYKGKLTWILANAETSLTSSSLGLTYRLTSKPSSVLEVLCR